MCYYGSRVINDLIHVLAVLPWFRSIGRDGRKLIQIRKGTDC
jgi:hypothetical protein